MDNEVRYIKLSQLPINPEEPHPRFTGLKLPLPSRGEGTKGWGRTAVGERFDLKLRPMSNAKPILTP
jgi:hypothetical protein